MKSLGQSMTLRAMALLWGAVVASAPTAAQLSAPPGVNEGAGNSIQLLDSVRIDQNLGAQLPLETVVRNHRGEEVTFGSLLQERPALISLVYYECPMLCSLAIEGFMRDHLNVACERRMAVLDPLRVVIENYPEDGHELLPAVNNPENPDAGKRDVPFGKTLYIERNDFMVDPPKKFHRLSVGKEVHLPCTN